MIDFQDIIDSLLKKKNHVKEERAKLDIIEETIDGLLREVGYQEDVEENEKPTAEEISVVEEVVEETKENAEENMDSEIESAHDFRYPNY